GVAAAPRAQNGSLRADLGFAFALVVYATVCVDAFLLEPNWPRIVRIPLTGDVSEPLTILQLSDLHIEKHTPARERWLFDVLEELQPDLILLPGDVHQMENMDVGILREKLSGLSAPLGVYACSGYDSVRMMNEACPTIAWLENRAVVLRREGDTIGLAGLDAVGKHEPVYESIASTNFKLAIHHTPGLAEEAAAHGMDLYLCGHTHGGQVRIPFWGAIITNSPTGKRFERGIAAIGKMVVYTSSGLGLEPPPAPQVRFLCRPEITLITVRPSR
ncbi:MAG TPA: hypothetical protein PLO37_26365, partial [Candidatus Hydrogenedentes bacterium]|nr:hypothetical protein [Candidatus Hydrogenedentota bacterium]HPG70380.1 hypothetical protein [Candidatus Hydrogenedentota bacterium]